MTRGYCSMNREPFSSFSSLKSDHRVITAKIRLFVPKTKSVSSLWLDKTSQHVQNHILKQIYQSLLIIPRFRKCMLKSVFQLDGTINKKYLENQRTYCWNEQAQSGYTQSTHRPYKSEPLPFSNCKNWNKRNLPDWTGDVRKYVNPRINRKFRNQKTSNDSMENSEWSFRSKTQWQTKFKASDQKNKENKKMAKLAARTTTHWSMVNMQPWQQAIWLL